MPNHQRIALDQGKVFSAPHVPFFNQLHQFTALGLIKPLVDIAADVMADESQRIGISYTGFCLTGLPHKRLPDEMTWEKKGHRVTLWVEPGRMKTRGRLVPYGARARMILLYLQTQAVRTESREVAEVSRAELGAGRSSAS
jgi:Plasmid encoded RepA protein